MQRLLFFKIPYLDGNRGVGRGVGPRPRPQREHLKGDGRMLREIANSSGSKPVQPKLMTPEV